MTASVDDECKRNRLTFKHRHRNRSKNDRANFDTQKLAATNIAAGSRPTYTINQSINQSINPYHDKQQRKYKKNAHNEIQEPRCR